MLTPAGLSAFDESVLRRLIATGDPHTPGSLTEDLGAPPEQVRRSVRRLIELGLALRDGAVVVPVDPRVALTGLVRERRTELDRLTQTIDELSAGFHDRAVRTGAAWPVETVVGRSAIAARFHGLMAHAGNEILAFDTAPYVASTDDDSEAETGALARGVIVRAVYATEVLEHTERADRVRALVQLGEQARAAPSLPAKLVIADRREAILPLSGPEAGDADSRCAVVHASGLCEALIALFEAIWTQAVPLFAPRAGANPDLAEDHAILQCLNAGMKDDVIARQLSISERTVRRRVADLAARLGATSRFQIGAQAARRGWV